MLSKNISEDSRLFPFLLFFLVVFSAGFGLLVMFKG